MTPRQPDVPADELFGTPVKPVDGIRVGIGGWTFPPWRDNFYPTGLVQRRELEYASRQLSAIEINGTYYGAQKPATYAKWAAQTPPGFMFSVKAPRHVAQRGTLAGGAKAASQFISGGLAEFGDRLGPLLWQLPPSRRFEPGDLRGFLEKLPRELNSQRLRHVLEVRNPGFACSEYLALAREQSIATVFTDSPDYPSFADLTGDFAYARLMRSCDEEVNGYDPVALDAWAGRARQWAQGVEPDDLPRVGPEGAVPGKPREVFVYFISAAKQRNPAAAKALIERLRD